MPLTYSSKNATFTQDLRSLHDYLRKEHPFIERISVALYDDATDMLKTYSNSTYGDNPLKFYEFPLGKSASLSESYRTRSPRIIDDLENLAGSAKQTHSQKIYQSGYRSSYTYPIFFHDKFFGFVFFNAKEPSVFSEEVAYRLNYVADLIGIMIQLDHQMHTVLDATLKSTIELTGLRDNETKEHTYRVAHYARLIALEIAESHQLNDEFIENVFQFAPLHDVGKIAIPDSILLKPGKLTVAEFDIMKSHVSHGAALIRKQLETFQLEELHQAQILLNIVLYHHEAMDGSGYQEGLKGEEIPIEARITSVADIFDALTTERPYKHAWSNQEAFDELHKMSGWKLDPACVDALYKRSREVESIQSLFGRL
ncbi:MULTISPECIES: HD domain-containing phosphohydrolase [Thiomicrorhabdus]|uniref:HD domain-containing protein n=1 Tax=Thiomicrorhabdus heinhorstiae TaxID=2748010 RepID=A0ABS0BWT2_9GAMM|nr:MULTISPECIES: HD domain-containing phosphohydrolase [Thiomicrorhabdus]MBF6058267.1 HD domain-containing protein [Thiomicrorhabdus heinhorstiae]